MFKLVTLAMTYALADAAQELTNDPYEDYYKDGCYFKQFTHWQTACAKAMETW